MYSFLLKDSTSNFDIVTCRILFAVSATAAFVQLPLYGWVAIFSGLCLIIVSLYINKILLLFKVPSFVLLVAGILLLCLITRSPYFALILLLHWGLNKFFNKKTKVVFDETGLVMTKPIQVKIYSWHELEYVVLKDGLLTIDFKTNHFIQSAIQCVNEDVDETLFNEYCQTHL